MLTARSARPVAAAQVVVLDVAGALIGRQVISSAGLGEQLRTKSPDPVRLRKETERRKRRCAGAVLVWDNRETEMAYLAEVKALLLALVGRSPGAEGVFLNQNLAVSATCVLRDVNADFLGTLARRLFDLVHEPRDCLRLVEFYDDMLDGVGARASPTRRARAGMSVEQMLNRVSWILG
jgi:hypothetical protein